MVAIGVESEHVRLYKTEVLPMHKVFGGNAGGMLLMYSKNSEEHISTEFILRPLFFPDLMMTTYYTNTTRALIIVFSV